MNIHHNFTALTVSTLDVTIAARDLLPALDLMHRVIERRNTIPILSNVMIDARPDGTIVLHGNDLDNQVRITLQGDVSGIGATTVSAATLRDLIKKAVKSDKGARITLRDIGGKLAVSYGRINQSLPTLPRDDMPVLAFPIAEDIATFILPAQWASDLVKVAPFASFNDNKYYLAGVCVQTRDGMLRTAATNGEILAELSDAMPDGLAALDQVIIASKAVKLIQSIAKANPDAPLLWQSARGIVSIECGNTVITAKAIDGTYPNYWDCIPTGEMDGLLLPELDARLDAGKVSAIQKAMDTPLLWETGAVPIGDGYCARVTSASAPNWVAIVMCSHKQVAPQGYKFDAGYTVDSVGASYPVATKCETVGQDHKKRHMTGAKDCVNDARAHAKRCDVINYQRRRFERLVVQGLPVSECLALAGQCVTVDQEAATVLGGYEAAPVLSPVTLIADMRATITPELATIAPAPQIEAIAAPNEASPLAVDKEQEDWRAFVADHGAPDQGGTPPSGGNSPPLPMETRERAPVAGMAEKLRGMAEAMQKDIDVKYSDRRENTPKQMRQAASARMDGDNLKRAQRMMRALADHHEAGTVPATLARITTKAAIVELAQEFIDRSNAGYYDAGIATGKPYSWRETAKQDQAAALWALLDTKGDTAARDAAQLQSDIAGLKFAAIDGYFPTPAPIVTMMIDQARMSDGLSLLEPSAGSGAILDAVKAEYPETRLTVFEKSHRLADILKRKGYELAGDDITDAPTLPPIDRVLMNPPFERGQDIEHVRIAFDLLKEGGRLVSIMSPAPFFHQSAKASAFRAWFDAIGGEKIDLPDGSFKSSGTGVSTVMVIIDKD